MGLELCWSANAVGHDVLCCTLSRKRQMKFFNQKVSHCCYSRKSRYPSQECFEYCGLVPVKTVTPFLNPVIIPMLLLQHQHQTDLWILSAFSSSMSHTPHTVQAFRISGALASSRDTVIRGMCECGIDLASALKQAHLSLLCILSTILSRLLLDRTWVKYI